MIEKKVLVLATLLLGIMLSVILLGGCATAGGSKATLSDPTMARSVNKATADTIDKTSLFTPDTPIIYCCVKLNNGIKDTIKAQWIYVGGDAKGMEGRVLYETARTLGATQWVSTSLTYDPRWPRGDYKVVLYLNDEEKFTVPFKVQ